MSLAFILITLIMLIRSAKLVRIIRFIIWYSRNVWLVLLLILSSMESNALLVPPDLSGILHSITVKFVREESW